MSKDKDVSKCRYVRRCTLGATETHRVVRHPEDKRKKRKPGGEDTRNGGGVFGS